MNIIEKIIDIVVTHVSINGFVQWKTESSK